jgi:hypothetical protein
MHQFYFNTSAAQFSQMAAAPTNGQRQTSTPSAGPQPMPGTQNTEFSYNAMYAADMQTVMNPPTAPIPQKTAKKSLSKAILIIDPKTGKSIFDKNDQSSDDVNSSEDKVSVSGSSHDKEDGHGEKDNAEPQTPVVSAMSDGPSVDITPKHQVNKVKKT